MLFLKSLIFWLIFLISILLLSPILIFLRIFSYSLALSIAKVWAFIIIKSLKIFCNLKYKIIGKKNLNLSDKIVFSKHQSTWETIFFILLIPKPVFVVKKELMFIPLFGWCLYLLGNIGIDRNSGRKAIKKMILNGNNLIKKGHTIIIFPEGTRVPYKFKTVIKKGGLLMTRSMNLGILPVTHDAGKYWPKHSFIKYPGTIKMIIGKPIPSHVISSHDFKNRIEKWMDKAFLTDF
jgi:1-acyl-sn-glycerol-3-phosphate acyltransferase